MKTLLPPTSHRRGLTLIEVLVIIAIVAVIVALFFPISTHTIPFGHQLITQVSKGKSLYAAMVNYAGTGDYPLYRDKNDPATRVADSNGAFEILLQGGYLDDKKLCFQVGSAWCKKIVVSEATAKQVLPGENDWCYVAGLNRSTAHKEWPILANAFVPGTTHYSTDIAKKGGNYKGTKAVVIYCGGNAEIEDTLEKEGTYIVRRPDKVQEDAFVPDGEWLTGPNVKVLYPKGE